MVLVFWRSLHRSNEPGLVRLSGQSMLYVEVAPDREDLLIQEFDLAVTMINN